MSVIINKAVTERIHKEEPETCKFDHIAQLHHADGIFYKEDRPGIKELDQDPYLICHDIIADLFYKQLNGNNQAYTSSSSIAGHHSMSESGTLIFCGGVPFYCYDDTLDENSEIESLEEWDA